MYTIHSKDFLTAMRHPLLKVGGLAVVWFAGIMVLLYFSVVTVRYNDTISTPPFSAAPFIQTAAHWDSTYYLDIATRGYQGIENSHLAFFPAYPMLIAAANYVTPNPLTASLVVNLLATIVSCLFLFLIAEHLTQNRSKAWRAVCLFLFYPTAYFLVATYSEAVFSCFGFGAFYFAFKRNWIMAALFASVASGTRLPGLLVSIGVAIEYLFYKKWKMAALVPTALILLASSLGFIFYCLYLWKYYGSPLIVQDVYHTYWPSRVFSLNYLHTFRDWKNVSYGYLQSHQYSLFFNRLIPILSWVVSGVVVVSSLKKIPISLSVFSILCLLLYAATNTPDSINRYVLPLFPVYLILADRILTSESKYGLWLGLSAASMGTLLTAYATNYWTG